MPRPTTKPSRGGKSSGPGSGSGKNRGDAQNERETTISKAMSFVLRHGAQKEGVGIDERGYVNVGELLSWPRLSSLNVTFPELQSIVETNAKQRFALIPAPDLSPNHDPLNPAHHLIRATQGHSLPIASENLLTPIQLSDPDCPDHVVHGTYDSKWKLILQSGGLRPMGRQHVHFALGLPSAGSKPGSATSSSSPATTKERQKQKEETSEQISSLTSTFENTTLVPAPTLSPSLQPSASANEIPSSEAIISGMRANASVLIWVDLKGSLEAGALRWWRSANGVVLTEGDAEGKVGLEWVDRVERRGGEVFWRREKGEGLKGGKVGK